MIVSPAQLLIKTAANYLAFKSVKSGVDYCTNRTDSNDHFLKAVECVVCLNVWSSSPASCPHCDCTVLRKLYRDYDNKKIEEDPWLEIDSNLTIKRPK